MVISIVVLLLGILLMYIAFFHAAGFFKMHLRSMGIAFIVYALIYYLFGIIGRVKDFWFPLSDFTMVLIVSSISLFAWWSFLYSNSTKLLSVRKYWIVFSVIILMVVAGGLKIVIALVKNGVPFVGEGLSVVAYLISFFFSTIILAGVLESIFNRYLLPLSWALILSLFLILPVIFSFLELVNISLPFLNVLIYISFSGSLLACYYVNEKQDLFIGLSLTREKIVGMMEEGWIVLDESNRIIDYNQSALNYFGSDSESPLSKRIEEIIKDFPAQFRQRQEVVIRKILPGETRWQYFNMNITSLENRSSKRTGSLVVLKDITKRKMIEESRQRARDEMFVLLNSISSAAGQALNQEEFLTEVIHQIIYPFSCQLALIYLYEDKKKVGPSPMMRLVAKYGLPEENTKQMERFLASAPLFVNIFEEERALSLQPDDPLIKASFYENLLEYQTLLAIPMIVKSEGKRKYIGCLFLGRHLPMPYSATEVVRIETVVPQIAVMIDSFRKRSRAIVSIERQRLLRDLHDSVSQKLYGLVAITEAVQAAKEAGSSVNLSDYIKRISENARQAVKEMRLFLYQLQPIDLEKDGLVSVLHYRLAAVEGRADIKARLLADKDLQIPMDKQIALYFIAQEALNNILRHANATEVNVVLKQSRKYIRLEVVDNGKGFDLKKVEKGGLGLKNMKERALLEEGTFKIKSQPGHGTSIFVVFSHEIQIPERQEEDSV